MSLKKIVLKANNGRYSIVCEIEVYIKETTHFFYSRTDPEVLTIIAPGWFKEALGDLSWEYVKQKIKEQAKAIENGKDGMELIIRY